MRIKSLSDRIRDAIAILPDVFTAFDVTAASDISWHRRGEVTAILNSKVMLGELWESFSPVKADGGRRPPAWSKREELRRERMVAISVVAAISRMTDRFTVDELLSEMGLSRHYFSEVMGALRSLEESARITRLESKKSSEKGRPPKLWSSLEDDINRVKKNERLERAKVQLSDERFRPYDFEKAVADIDPAFVEKGCPSRKSSDDDDVLVQLGLKKPRV